MKDFLTTIFPHYTPKMYDGDAPCGIGHELITGGYADRWECRYGGGETNGGVILHANFSIDDKITIFIVDERLRIVDIRYSGKPDVFTYQNYKSTNQLYSCEHPLETERIDKILSKNFDCEFWRMVQKRAIQLYQIKERK